MDREEHQAPAAARSSAAEDRKATRSTRMVRRRSSSAAAASARLRPPPGQRARSSRCRAPGRGSATCSRARRGTGGARPRPRRCPRAPCRAAPAAPQQRAPMPRPDQPTTPRTRPAPGPPAQASRRGASARTGPSSASDPIYHGRGSARAEWVRRNRDGPMRRSRRARRFARRQRAARASMNAARSAPKPSGPREEPPGSQMPQESRPEAHDASPSAFTSVSAARKHALAAQNAFADRRPRRRQPTAPREGRLCGQAGRLASAGLGGGLAALCILGHQAAINLGRAEFTGPHGEDKVRSQPKGGPCGPAPGNTELRKAGFSGSALTPRPWLAPSAPP